MPLTAFKMGNKLTDKLSDAICVMTGYYLVFSNTSLPIQKNKSPHLHEGLMLSKE